MKDYYRDSDFLPKYSENSKKIRKYVDFLREYTAHFT